MSQEATEVRDVSAAYAPQVKKPVLPSGYKQTEVGVIPEDWDVMNLAEVCSSICDGTHYTPRYVSQGIPFYSVENVTANDFENTKFITEAEHATLIKRCKPERGDILMTRITAGIVGDTRIIDWDVNASIYVSLALLKPNDQIESEYLYRYSRSTAFVKDTEKRALTNATPKKINMQDIGAIPVPVPRNAEEQRAIATALSDVDALLKGLDRLIAKKRDLKQAAMQQLLTGQTRLPGFEGEWEVKRLGDHVTFLRNGVSSRAELTIDDRVKYLHYGDIHACSGTYMSPKDLPSLPTEKAKTLGRLLDGDLIFADASEDLEGVGKSVEIRDAGDTELVAGLHTIAARFDTKVLADGFKAYLQFSPGFIRHLRRLAAGTKVYATNRAHVASVEMSLPSIEEQAAIASVFRDMDAELEALEQRRAKTRDLKQAIMQELLTGRTRLI